MSEMAFGYCENQSCGVNQTLFPKYGVNQCPCGVLVVAQTRMVARISVVAY